MEFIVSDSQIVVFNFKEQFTDQEATIYLFFFVFKGLWPENHDYHGQRGTCTSQSWVLSSKDFQSFKIF